MTPHRLARKLSYHGWRNLHRGRVESHVAVTQKHSCAAIVEACATHEENQTHEGACAPPELSTVEAGSTKTCERGNMEQGETGQRVVPSTLAQGTEEPARKGRGRHSEDAASPGSVAVHKTAKDIFVVRTSKTFAYKQIGGEAEAKQAADEFVTKVSNKFHSKSMDGGWCDKRRRALQAH